ncbi:dynein axonemal heavy chain 3-like [Mercenaria mercenaria]|uniref:dynein axonemal heavy chain 3-like n=1 Tax=Mercenaria mercenaria TaxID=6596 RepID=UPI00234E6051|nr:dynein axonemal heavy chain 3-like [Mercenaria mercenaria]
MPHKQRHGFAVAEPNEFEKLYRPSVIQHLPPLSAREPALSEKPQILERGSWTKAAPIKEKKHHIHVSDSIGNNYSPTAQHLTSSYIYENYKNSFTGEESYYLTPRQRIFTQPPPIDANGAFLTVRAPKNIIPEYASVEPTNWIYGINGRRRSAPSVAFRSDPEFHVRPPGFTTLPQIQSTSGLGSEIETNTVITNGQHSEQNGKPVKDSGKSVHSLSESVDSGLGISGAYAPGMTPVPEAESQNGEDMVDGEESDNKEDLDDVEEVETGGYCEKYDRDSIAALQVEFPPFYFSTHGLSRPSTPVEDDTERYYSLVEKAIEPIMISPVEEETLQGIYKFVPKQLRMCVPQAARHFLQEMEEDRRYAIKKAIMDYILLDQKEQTRLGIPIPLKPSNSAGRLGFPWHQRVNEAREFMRKDLYITHPVMYNILYHFHSKYGDFRLIDIPGLLEIMPITMEDFLKHVQESTKAGVEKLRYDWLPECCAIVDMRREEVEQWMPQDNEVLRQEKMDHFFNSIAMLMSNLLRYTVCNSIKDLLDLVEDYHEGNSYEDDYSIFKGLALPQKLHPVTIFMKEDMENVEVTFKPKFPDTCDFFCAIIDFMVISVAELPRIEHLLFEAVEDLDISVIKTVQIEEELVIDAKDRIKTVIYANSHGPLKYRSLYEPYKHLISEDADKQVDKFLSRDRSLREYTREIEKLKKMEFDIASFPVFVPMYFFLLDCSHLNQWMVDRARHLVKRMVDNIMVTSEKFNRNICKQYDAIVKNITRQSERTDELVAQMKYVEGLRAGELLKLKEKQEVAAGNLMFLMHYGYLPKDDILLNNNTFSWAERIIPMITSTELKLQKEHDYYSNKLIDWQKRFQTQLDTVAKQLKDFSGKDRMSEAEVYTAELKDIQDKIEFFQEEKTLINREEQMLGVEHITQYPQIQDFIAQKEPFDKLWTTAVHFHAQYDKWMNGPLLNVNAEVVEEEIQTLWKTVYKLMKNFSQKHHQGPMRAAATIKSKLQKFQINLPLINSLCNPGIKQRHWDMMSEKVGFNMAPTEETPLMEVLQLGLEKYLDKLQLISNQASKEFALENALKKMKEDWKNMHFSFVQYKDTGISILAAPDDIQVLLDDHIVKTMTMKGSPFIGPFEEEVNEWDLFLHRMKDTLESWLNVQAAWLYLEPIFGSEDIRSQIPVEGQMFVEVDEHWRTIMSNAVKNTEALVVVSQDNMLEKLKHSESMLDDIQKGLNNYLEKKRLFFPRFFFLSNDELLEILSETKDPLRVQPHLKKCFEGISQLSFDVDKVITAMESAENEVVPFAKKIVPAQAKGLVERWLLQVEEVMKLSLKEVSLKATEAYPKIPRGEWVLQWPGQIVLAASQIHWTTEVTQSIKYHSLGPYLQKSNKQIEEVVTMVRGSLSKMARITLGALIVIDVHARDVVQNLTDIDIQNPLDFSWISQLRYYKEEEGTMVRMITTTVAYGYEYLGNTGRLVITPLTDRCYRTLMGALLLNLGGAPEGPAGTGKTETSKDLAKAVAKQCVVFNCSDGLDYKAMGKFFKGLAQSGAWACFDEFNRIELEVLSVIAQQVQTIQRAIAEQLQTFVFEGTEISLDPTCTIFITMNPGYAGRAELPDNLKVLFRTVAMMIPDYAMIAEISLYSMGFVDARSLSTKIVATYKLCSEQLSSQHHYDYGMRAVKSVLTAAGNLKIKYPEQREDVLVLRSINDVNLPKFLSHDIPLFEGIISDLFPGVELPKPDYDALESALIKHIESRNLQAVPYFTEKIIQIYDMILVRHGLMIVGDPLAGKSSSFMVLADSLADLHKQGLMEENGVWYRIINPKAVTMGQLYGRFDPVSHEWTDGILANTFREHASSTTHHRKWIIFDGPVDAVWIENMNTVLDDNKKLCLMSGEIIQMNNKQNMIFEPQDLEQASPATVSRCGMIYMDPLQLGWQPLVKSWMATSLPDYKLTQEQKDTIRLLFEWLLPPCLNYVNKYCKHMLTCHPMHLTMSMLRLYTCLLEDIKKIGEEEDDDEDIFEEIPEEEEEKVEEKPTSVSEQKIIEEKTNMIICYFLFSMVWSVGATLDENSRIKFDEFFRSLCEMESVKDKNPRNEESDKPPRPKDLKLSRGLLIPKRGLIYDHVYIKRQYGSWHQWSSLLTNIDIDEQTKLDLKDEELYSEYSYIKLPDVIESINELIINTMETERQKYFLERLLLNDKPLLLVGPTGTGKSAITNNYLSSLPKDKYIINNVNFSAQTSANQTQDIIFSKLDRRKKGVYGPNPGKQLVVFVDDLNMPAKEKYGAQPPIEVLRQWIDQGYWFDRKDTSILNLVDISMLCAMGPPGGGRNNVTPRFLRHFNVVSILSFDEDTMKNIFAPIVDWHFRSFETAHRKWSRIIVSATLEIYQKAIQNFLPSPSRSHYVFNLRDFARVVQGVLLLKSEVVPDGQEGSQKIIRLWIHEVYRVFYDRLVDETDRDTFFGMVKTSVEGQFKDKMPSLFSHITGDPKAEVTDDNIRSLLFGDYLNKGKTEKLYDEIQNLDELREVIEQCLEEYNMMSKAPMDLVMFRFAIEHISRISRVLKQPNGHCLLVGIGGSGRQSATKLAAFMSDFELFSIEITKNYNMPEWRDDLRKMMRKAGDEGISMVFLFGDHQIKDVAFLEDVNMILNTGDIPNLYDNEDRLEIIEKMQVICQNENSPLERTPLNMYNKFIERVRRNLHVVLAFSPIGDAFRARIRMFPSLINCCTIDWFKAWPEDALELVANKFLDEVEMTNEVREETVVMCKHFHESVRALSERFYNTMRRRNYVTPTSYLELIKTFKNLLNKKRLEILTLKNRYQVGLEKLDFSEQQINIMQKELIELRPQLIQTSKETKELIAFIEKESVEVQQVKQVVEVDEAAANKAAQESHAIKLLHLLCKPLLYLLQNLEDNIALTKVKIERAEKLISGLGGEKERWTKNVEDLSETYDNIIGDVLLSASVVAYLGPFILAYRQECLKEWYTMCEEKGIPLSEQFSLSGTLGDPVKIRDWQIAGLPVDNFSTDNALIATSANRWPLMIDPQGQANKWVKNMEKSSKLEVIKQSDQNFTRSLENCVQFGNPCLLENVGEELDPILEPILLKQTFKQSGLDYMRIGDQVVEYSKDFRFYITSRLRNPHYLPEVSVKVTLLNFMITPLGLDDQLLGIVAAKEKPELEEKKNQLILESAHNKRQLKEIEDRILEVLSESEGNILEDETAIEVLSSSKVLSLEISEKEKIASHTEKEIDEVRNGYKPVAKHGSILFFTISDLANIDPMYQYSLTWFINLYLQSIINSEPSVVLEERIGNLNNHFTYSIYKNVCRSLFEKDKLLFSFILCIGIAKAEGTIDDIEWRFLLTGGVALENPFPNPAPAWLSEKSWSEIVRCSDLHAFKGFMDEFREKLSLWKKVYDSPTPQSEKLPDPWQAKLSKLQKLIVLRCLRPDKMVSAIQTYIQEAMGQKYIEPPTFDLSLSYEDSNSASPLIFVLSPGADPMAGLFRFAEEKGIIARTLSRQTTIHNGERSKSKLNIDLNPKPPSLGVPQAKGRMTEADRRRRVSSIFGADSAVLANQERLARMGSKGLQTISLGQGQGPIAEKMIMEAVELGTWVVLQNCHLAASWLGELERICETVITDSTKTKDCFRLWLTSYPSPDFPVSVLQNGVKMTNEPPAGLRANLLRSYLNDPISDPAFFNSCNKPKVFEKLLFGLCFFHALVQERRKFAALGWNIPYEFNESDLRISVRQLEMFINDYDTPPLEALTYLTGECNYGGRVTDDMDRRLIISLLKIFYCEDIIYNDNYKFSDSGTYYAPPNGSYDNYVSYIRSLPLIPHPEVFGLHENADITKDQKETQQLFDGILLTLPRQPKQNDSWSIYNAAKITENSKIFRKLSGGGKSSQDVIEELASDILTKIPPDFNLEEIQTKYPVRYEESMNTVLVQELIRFNRLIQVVRTSLQDIRKAIKGLVLMSSELEDMFDSMMVGKVPAMWAAKSYPSLKPLGSYITDLLARLQFFKEWVYAGSPIVMWISGFYFTQSFLTGVLQNYARRYQIPIDHLGFEFEVMGHDTSMPQKPKNGAYIRGVFMEGARWDKVKKCIEESQPKILYETVPVIWLKPGKSADFEHKEEYSCPIYKTSARRGVLSTTGHSTNWVMNINLPTKQPENHWINRGVACLCQLDN